MNLDRLKDLSAISAPSGYEDRMIEYMRREMSQFVSSVSVDRLGNVIAHLPAVQLAMAGPVMLFAHMDELGFIVRKIEQNGFLRLERLGGVPERTAPARPIVVLGSKGPVPGVIGHKSHHYTPPEEKYQVLKIRDLYVDLGVRSQQSVLNLGVSVGDPVTYAPYYSVIEDTVMAKSIDNRIGCEVLLSVLENLAEQPLTRDLYFVATTQEEFNLSGILPTYSLIRPEIAIGIDIVVACDTPDLAGVSDTHLGGGPAISRYTFHGRGTLGGLIPNPRLVTAMIQSAQKHGIPYQQNVSMGLLTDTSFYQLQGEGVHCLDVGIPARYTHSPVEAAAISDVNNLIDLLTYFLGEMPPHIDLNRG
jgi:putative aminopeptidase